MASILEIGGRWRAQVRRRGTRGTARTFDTREEAEAWAAHFENNIGLLKRSVGADPLMKPAAYQVCGVYVLYLGPQMQYVGRSIHIYRRLYEHSRSSMEWDGFRIWPCRNAVDQALLERKLIEEHQPPYNTSMLPKYARKRPRGAGAAS